MNKRILITATELMMVQFLVPHVKNLAENGYRVEVACSNVGGRLEETRKALEGAVTAFHEVRLERSPLSPRNILGYGDMRKIIQPGKYDIIWTNEPVMGVVTRLAARKARKAGTKVMYMCHGFHFYQGASKLNWMLYYPVERLMSRFTDVLTTLNREDEARAKTFHAKRVEYIHGIGVNTDRLQQRDAQTNIRAELGLKDGDFLVLSVGELNENKNHQAVIRAIAKLKDPAIHYAICGKGALLDKLTTLAAELGLGGNVHFLGYRKDVVDICSQADVFAHPSMREGLSVASLEAMYCGLPLVMSTVRGAGDYLEDGVSGFLRQAHDVDGFADALSRLKADPQLRKRCGERNQRAVEPYCLSSVKKQVVELVDSLT